MPIIGSRQRKRNRQYKKKTFKRPYKRMQRKRRSSKRRRAVFSKQQKTYLKKLIDVESHNDQQNTWRTLETGTLASNVNEHKYQAFSFLDRSVINTALAANVETTTTGTKIDVKGIDGAPDNDPVDNFTRSLKTVINKANLKFKIRNNCNVPVKLSYWKLANKRRFDITKTPITSIQEGLVATGLGAGAITDIRYNPSDSPAFKLHYKVFERKSMTLMPGKEHTVTLSRRTPFKYSHDEDLAHAASHFDPQFTQWLLFKTTGVIGHASGLTEEVGRCSASLDFELLFSMTSEAVSSSYRWSHISADYLPTIPTVPICTVLDTNNVEPDCKIVDTNVTSLPPA